MSQRCSACGGKMGGPTITGRSGIQHASAEDCVAFCRRPGFSRNPARPGSSLRRVTITLEEEQYIQLVGALGLVTGAAILNCDERTVRMSRRLANAVSAGNPDWAPYAVETETAR
jgi:hypothetical protein